MASLMCRLKSLASFQFKSGFATMAVAMFASAVLIANLGCEPPKNAGMGGVTGKNSTPNQTMSHDHDHEHEHGPNGGHLVDMAPSGLHAEWLHDEDANKMTIYFDDFKKAGKKVNSAKVLLTAVGNPEKTYELKSNDQGVFEIVDPELLTAIEMSTGEKDAKVSGKLLAMVDGKEESGSVVHEDHGHHH